MASEMNYPGVHPSHEMRLEQLARKCEAAVGDGGSLSRDDVRSIAVFLWAALQDLRERPIHERLARESGKREVYYKVIADLRDLCDKTEREASQTRGAIESLTPIRIEEGKSR